MRGSLLTVLFCLPTIPAQSRETAPADRGPVLSPILTFEVSGPGALRQAFLPTNLGALIGADETKGIWEKIFTNVAGVWYRSEGAVAQDTFTPFRNRLAGYRGRMRVRLFAAPRRGWCGAIEFLPDGKTDLESLGKGLSQLVENAHPAGTKPLPFGDKTLAVTLSSVPVTLPILHRERIVLFVGPEIDTSIGEVDALLRGEPVDPKKRFFKDPIRLRVDLEHFGRLLGDPARPSTVDEFFGLDRARAVEMRVAPSGPHTRFDFALEVDEPFTGIFDVLLPQTANPPAVDHVPDVPVWSVISFSYTKLWTLLMELTDGESLDSFVGFRIKEDLIDNLHPGFTVYGDGADEWCVALRVKDASAVEGCLVALHTGDEPEISVHRGTEIRTRASRFDRTTHAASHGGRLLFAFGDDGLEFLKKAVDRSLRRAKEGKPVEAPPVLMRTQSSRPPGCNGMGLLQTSMLRNSALLWFFDEGFREIRRALPFLGDPDLPRVKLAELSTLFTKHRLEQIVWYTGRTKGRFHFRMVW